MEGFADASALFAVSGHHEAARITTRGLASVQHRGAGGAAIAACDGALLRYRWGAGRVDEAIGATALGALSGRLAIGHVWGRGEHAPVDAPDGADGERMAFARYHGGQAAAAIAGRFTNGARLRRELKEAGALFHTPSDGELLLHLLASSQQKTFVNRLVDALWKVDGAYALVVACEDRVIALRDPAGVRPLVLGRLGEAVVVASEDTAIRAVGGEVRREVHPGEMVILDGRMMQSVTPFPRRPAAACVHEYVSLARADAAVFGRAAHDVRGRLGERLGRDQPCPDADVVAALPGADAHAVGFARSSRLPLEAAFLRESATGEWRAVPSAVGGRSVALVAPSLATGRTLRRGVRLLLDAGASQVHVRVAAPPVRAACVYGVSTPTADELLTTRDADPVEWLGATSVAFLSLEALHEVAGGSGFCDACFSGIRPIAPEEADDQLPLF